MCRQLAYFAAGDLGTFDVIKLAYSLCTYYEVRPRKDVTFYLRLLHVSSYKYIIFYCEFDWMSGSTWLVELHRLSNSHPLLLYPTLKFRHVSSPY